LISETLDRLSGAKRFTRLDLRDAYYRICIKRGDEWKTAFRTRYGHFEYMVMPFGLTNALATFQSYINQALKGYLDITSIVFLDDIMMYSEEVEDHIKHVKQVLKRLRQFGLYAKLSKCLFNTTKVDFLGYVVGVAGILMNLRRVATIRD
jgi:Reverse transcriptase (RNA-dependent DNA polymerase)